MKAELERQLASLSPEEKEEVYYFLMPHVLPDEDEDVSPELMAELERRLVAHLADPSAAITLEDFKSRKFNRQ